MKKQIIVICIAIIYSFALHAQEQLSHQKKTFVDKNGKLYWNKALPVFFRVSTSKNEGAQSYLLKSESSPQYSNPMYFDIDGYNTLRSPSRVDTVTKKVVLPKQDVRFEMYADGLPPKSTALFKGAPRYTQKSKVYYGKGLYIEIKSKDATSGTEKTYYSIDGEAYKEYKSNIEINTEKEDISLSYYSVDNVGNVEKAKKVSFSYDATPPFTKRSIQGKFFGKVLSGSAKIVLTSTDAMSGVYRTFYSIDGKKPKLYTKPLSATLFRGGSHKLAFFSIDNVENNNSDDENRQNNENFLDIITDETGPLVNVEISGDQYKGKLHYVSSKTKIKITAEDENCEVDEINYSFGNYLMKNEYTKEILFPKQKGKQILYFSAYDEIGNRSPRKSKTYYVDNDSPITGVNIGKPQFFNRDTLFISKATPVIFFSKDYESGVKQTEYSINDAVFQKYDKKLILSNENFYKIKFKSIDNVNNAEQIKETHMQVDNNAPQIFVNFSIQKIRDESLNGETYPVYPTYTKMYIGATDKYSGTETIKYSINGGKTLNYNSEANISKTKLLNKAQFYTVKIIATDKLGNKNEKIIKFYIAVK